QDAVIKLRDLRLYALEYDRGVLPLTHQDGAVDDIVQLVHADHSLALLKGRGHFGNVTHEHGHAVPFGDHDVADIFGCAEQAHPANDELLFTLLDVAATGVHVAMLQALEQLLHRNAVGPHFGQVG